MSVIKKYKNPFQLFPQEVWEMLFDEMDCNEVETVWCGIPQIGVSVENLQRYWFIGKVLAILSSNLGLQDIMNLRLVCKQWKRRVDNFLQNQPYYRAYSESQDKFNSNFWSFLDKHQCSFVKGQVKTIDLDFIKNNQQLIIHLQKQPASINPFPFRLVKLDITMPADEQSDHISSMTDILEQFGNHVWCLDITLPSSMSMPEILAFTQILKLCPKVKNLRLELTTDCNRPVDIQPENLEYLQNNLPMLPQLKALKISKFNDFCSEYTRELSRRYCHQITRFATLEWVGQEGWNFYNLSKILPFLCELRIGIFSCNDEMPRVIELCDFIKHLEAPNFKMLQLKYVNKEDYVTISIENCIFPWLRKFNQLKFLEITPLHGKPFQEQVILKEEGTANSLVESFASLETLKIPDSKLLQYNFLKCFKSIKFLEIYTFNDPSDTDDEFLSQCSPFKKCITLLDGYNPVIWNLFPKLNVFLIMAHYGPCQDSCSVHDFYLSKYLKLQKFKDESNDNAK